MNSKSFSTRFEGIIKPKIADELGLRCLNQRYSFDFDTNDWKYAIELKLRMLRGEKNSGHYTPSKKQFDRIITKLNQRRLSGNSFFQTNFSYLFMAYSSSISIEDARSAKDVVESMTIVDAFLVDYVFVLKHDSSGKESNYHSTTRRTLFENTEEFGEIELIGSTLSLYLDPNEKYISDLANTLVRK